MKWKEITIYTTEEGTEIILARLDMLGITQVNICLLYTSDAADEL